MLLIDMRNFHHVEALLLLIKHMMHSGDSLSPTQAFYCIPPHWATNALQNDLLE